MKPSSERSARAREDQIDTELMCRVKYDHDHAAFARLLARLGWHIKITLRRLLPAAEIEDSAAEVALRLWEKRNQFQEERGQVRWWAATIARNHAWSWWRRTTNRCNPAKVEAIAANPERHDPGLLVERKDWAEFVRRSCEEALAMQPEYVRVSFALWLQGVSFLEISKQVGRPVGSIAGALHRFCRRLAARLDPDSPCVARKRS